MSEISSLAAAVAITTSAAATTDPVMVVPLKMKEDRAGAPVVQSVVHGGVARMEHTWTEAGPLGLQLKQRGETKDSPNGVTVSTVKSAALPGELKGMVIDEIAGESVCNKSYNDVLAKIKSCGRPLTIKFRGTVKATDSVVAPPKEVWQGHASSTTVDTPILVKPVTHFSPPATAFGVISTAPSTPASILSGDIIPITTGALQTPPLFTVVTPSGKSGV